MTGSRENRFQISKSVRAVLESPENLAERQKQVEKTAKQIELRRSAGSSVKVAPVATSFRQEPTRNLAKIENAAPNLISRSPEEALRHAYLKLNLPEGEAIRDAGRKYDQLNSQRNGLQKKWTQEKSTFSALQTEREQVTQQKWKIGKQLLLADLNRKINVSFRRLSQFEGGLIQLNHAIKKLESDQDLMDVFAAARGLEIKRSGVANADNPQTFASALKLLEDEEGVLRHWIELSHPKSAAATLDQASEVYDQLAKQKRHYDQVQKDLEVSIDLAKSIDPQDGSPFAQRFKKEQRREVLALESKLIAVNQKTEEIQHRMEQLRSDNPDLDRLLGLASSTSPKRRETLGRDKMSIEANPQKQAARKPKKSSSLKTESEQIAAPPTKVEVALEKRNRGLLQSRSELLVIGDSVASHLRRKLGQEVGFVGGPGLGSETILGKARSNPSAFKNRKMVLINAGGNDVSNKDVSEIMANIDALVGQAREAGIPKIFILTRIPYERSYGTNQVTHNMPKLAQALRAKYGSDSQVKLVDLNKRLADANGRLPEELANDETTTDKLHPYNAYNKALKIIAQVTGEPIITQWLYEPRHRAAG